MMIDTKGCALILAIIAVSGFAIFCIAQVVGG